MKTQSIRRFTTPLSKARKKDAGIMKAAVFVEYLFGRPLRSDPDVLIITNGNRAEILETLKRDYPNSILFSPLSFLASEPQMERLVKRMEEEVPDRKFFALGANAFKSPLRSYLRIQEARYEISFRLLLEDIAEAGTQTFLQNITKPFVNGVHAERLGMVVVNEAGTPITLAHELVHAEDEKIFGKIRGWFDLMVREGRATFTEMAFSLALKCEGREPVDIFTPSIAWQARMISRNLGEFKKEMEEKGAIPLMAEIYHQTLKATGLRYQLLYLPFAHALDKLATETGYAAGAFQIATEKPPQRLSHILHPAEYYSEEIQRFRADMRRWKLNLFLNIN